MATKIATKSTQTKAKTPKQAPLLTFKGFDKNLKCRDFQYAIGKSYENKAGAQACEYGFHACEYPLDVFGYYAPGLSRYALVEQSGAISRHGSDNNVASSKIKVKAEIDLAGLVKAAIEYTFSRATPENTKHSTGYRGAASSTGYQGAASSTGYQGAASSTGDQGAASSTGDRGAASSTGDRGAASSTGDWGAASSTGYRSAASSTGYRGAASSTGYRGAASCTGKHGVAMACGIEGRAMASAGNAIVLCYRDAGAIGDGYARIVHIKAGIAGKDGIKPDVWYVLDAAGEFVEVD